MNAQRIATIQATARAAAQEIKRHAALAFFACAYADQADENGQPLRGEIMDQLPPVIDTAATHAADTLTIQACAENGITGPDVAACLYALYIQAQRLQKTAPGDRPLNFAMFGHYLAMSAMGTGVGLESFGDAVHDGITVPYLEFGGYSLDGEYFTTAGDV